MLDISSSFQMMRLTAGIADFGGEKRSGGGGKRAGNMGEGCFLDVVERWC